MRIFCLAWMAVLSSACAAQSVASDADFQTTVLPVLTSAGCNAAACHGAAAGRGGFKLSLYAEDPAADYDAIVRQDEARRVNLFRPLESLLLKKPTGELDHEGGVRLEIDGPQAERIVRWLTSGAAPPKQRALLGIEAEPEEAFVAAVNSPCDVTVTARFSDGERKAVTADAIFAADDETAVSFEPVSAASGRARLTVLRPGKHTVVVRYLSQVASVQVVAPFSRQSGASRGAVPGSWIDEEVQAQLEQLAIPSAELLDGPRLWRRLRLDLTGLIPPLEETLACPDDLAGPELARRVDLLLASQEFNEYWTLQLARLLRIAPAPEGGDGMTAFHAWLKNCLREQTSWADMARAMLSAEGDTRQVGPASFYRIGGDARAQAEYVSESLLGVRMRCANCHNHPLDRWTQDDYHGLAAVFAPVEGGEFIRLAMHRRVSHPRTAEAAVPKLPGDRQLPFGKDLRGDLAEWLTSPNNPYFATAFANRLWKALIGRGLVEPVDDMRATNPATHPRLLARLGREFAADGYDLRATIRRIVLSDSYARSSRLTASFAGADGGRAQGNDPYYSQGWVRPLEAEVLYDAIADVCGVASSFPHVGVVRAVALASPFVESLELDALGRCGRQDSCDADPQQTRGLATALQLLNGPALNEKITNPQGRLHRLIDSGADDRAIIEELYLRALTRAPRPQEATWWIGQLRQASDKVERRKQLEDFLWSLLNCEEFTTNH